MSALLPDRAVLKTFIDVMFRHADPGTFVIFKAYDANDVAVFSAIGCAVDSPKLVDLATILATETATCGRPAVFCPPVATFHDRNPTRGYWAATTEDVANGVALSVDADQHPEATRATLVALLGEPTLESASGGLWLDEATGVLQERVHLHWRLTKPARTKEERLRLCLARKLAADLTGSDTSLVPLSHPLRWPGSVHNKAEPRLARIVAQTDNEIDLDEAYATLREAWGNRPGAEAERRSAEPTAEWDDVESAVALIPNDASVPWNDWKKVGMAIFAATGGAGFGIFDSWSEKRPDKYDPAGTEAGWDQIVRSPPKTIGAGTLFHLAKKWSPGWQQPSRRPKDASHYYETPPDNDAKAQTPNRTAPDILDFEAAMERKEPGYFARIKAEKAAMRAVAPDPDVHAIYMANVVAERGPVEPRYEAIREQHFYEDRHYAEEVGDDVFAGRIFEALDELCFLNRLTRPRSEGFSESDLFRHLEYKDPKKDKPFGLAYQLALMQHRGELLQTAEGLWSRAVDGDTATKEETIRSTEASPSVEPQPLPSGLLPVAPFDPAFLPEALGPWVADIAHRMQAPADFVGVSALCALATVIGHKVCIRPKANDPWTVTPNLWGFIVGDPGVAKSPAMAEGTKPLTWREGEARKSNDAAIAMHKQEVAVVRMRNKAASKAFEKALASDTDASADTLKVYPEPDPPAARRYIVGDSSYEKLADILSVSPNGVLVFNDELITLLKHLESEEQTRARGFYLTAWNGSTGYQMDRIVRGSSYIPRACISMLGATQPDRMADFVHRATKAGNDGMVQRFGLLVWPDKRGAWVNVDQPPDMEARDTAWSVFRYLDELDPKSIGVEQGEHDTQAFLRFDDEARRLFADWQTKLMARIDSGGLGNSLRNHLSKYPKLVPGLALINHLADRGAGSVSVGALRRAIAMAGYLETHAARAYGSGAAAEVEAARVILNRMQRRELMNGFVARELIRKQWSGLSDAAQVTAALDMLVDLGWLVANQIETSGRPRLEYGLTEGAAKKLWPGATVAQARRAV